MYNGVSDMKQTNLTTPRSMGECCFLPSHDPIEYGDTNMDTQDKIVIVGSILCMVAVIGMAVIGIVTI